MLIQSNEDTLSEAWEIFTVSEVELKIFCSADTLLCSNEQADTVTRKQIKMLALDKRCYSS